MDPVPDHKFKYDIFISYSATSDYQFSRQLESFLERIHKLKTPDDLKIRKLEACLDGSDFVLPPRTRRTESQNTSDDLFELISSHLEDARELLVLCSPASRHSTWMDREVEWFACKRGPQAIRLAVTEGQDPGGNPEGVFSERIIRLGLHRQKWYDFRGAHPIKKQPQQGVRDFEEIRLQLASDLLGLPLSRIQPLWFREKNRLMRRRWIVTLMVTIVLLSSLGFAAVQSLRAMHSHMLERRNLYHSNILLADRSILNHQFQLAQQAITKTPEEYRDWEWRYLRAQAARFQYAIALAPQTIVNTAISEQRRLIALALDSKRIEIRSLDTGNVLAWRRLDEEPGHILRFNQDGTLLTVQTNDRLYFLRVDEHALQQKELPDLISPIHDRMHCLNVLFHPNNRQAFIIRDTPLTEAKQPNQSTTDTQLSPSIGGTMANDLAQAISENLLKPLSESLNSSLGASDAITTVEVCDFEKKTVQQIASFPGRALSTSIDALGDRLVIGSFDGRIDMLKVNQENDRFTTETQIAQHSLIKDGQTIDLASLFLSCIALSPDGHLLAAASLRGNPVLYDSGSMQPIFELKRSQEKVLHLAFSPDSSFLLVIRDHCAEIWDSRTGMLMRAITSEGAKLENGELSDTTTMLALLSNNSGVTELWDLFNGELIGVLPVEGNEVKLQGFFDRCQRAVTVGEDRFQVWSTKRSFDRVSVCSTWPASKLPTKSGKLTMTLSTPSDSGTSQSTITGVRITEDRPESYDDRSSLEMGPEIRQLALSADGSRMVSVNAEGRVDVWATAPLRRIFTPKLSAKKSVEGAITISMGPHVVAHFGASASKVLITDPLDYDVLWDVDKATSRTLDQQPTLPSSSSAMESRPLVISQVGGPLWAKGTSSALGYASFPLIVYSENTSQPLSVHEIADEGPLPQFSPKRPLLGFAPKANTVVVTNCVTGKRLGHWNVSEDTISQMEFSPDGDQIALVTEKGKLLVALVSEMTSTELKDKNFPVSSCQWGAQGKRLIALRKLSSDATTESLCSMIIWDVYKRQVLSRIPLLGDKITAIAINPQGTRVFLATDSRELFLFNVDDGQPILTLHGLRASITQLVFTPDGSHLIASLKDGTLCEWSTQPMAIKSVIKISESDELKSSFHWIDLASRLHLTSHTTIQCLLARSSAAAGDYVGAISRAHTCRTPQECWKVLRFAGEGMIYYGLPDPQRQVASSIKDGLEHDLCLINLCQKMRKAHDFAEAKDICNDIADLQYRGAMLADIAESEINKSDYYSAKETITSIVKLKKLYSKPDPWNGTLVQTWTLPLFDVIGLYYAKQLEESEDSPLALGYTIGEAQKSMCVVYKLKVEYAKLSVHELQSYVNLAMKYATDSNTTMTLMLQNEIAQELAPVLVKAKQPKMALELINRVDLENSLQGANKFKATGNWHFAETLLSMGQREAAHRRFVTANQQWGEACKLNQSDPNQRDDSRKGDLALGNTYRYHYLNHFLSNIVDQDLEREASDYLHSLNDATDQHLLQALLAVRQIHAHRLRQAISIIENVPGDIIIIREGIVQSLRQTLYQELGAAAVDLVDGQQSIPTLLNFEKMSVEERCNTYIGIADRIMALQKASGQQSTNEGLRQRQLAQRYWFRF